MIQSTDREGKWYSRHPSWFVVVLVVFCLSLIHQATASTTRPSVPPPPPPPPPRQLLPTATRSAAAVGAAAAVDASVTNSEQPPPPPPPPPQRQRQKEAAAEDERSIVSESPKAVTTSERRTNNQKTTIQSGTKTPPSVSKNDIPLTKPEQPHSIISSLTPPQPPPPRILPTGEQLILVGSHPTLPNAPPMNTNRSLSLGQSQSLDRVLSQPDTPTNKEGSVSNLHQLLESAKLNSEQESLKDTESPACATINYALARDVDDEAMETKGDEHDSSSQTPIDEVSPSPKMETSQLDGNLQLNIDTHSTSAQPPHTPESTLELHGIHPIPSSPYPVQTQQFRGSSSFVSSQPQRYYRNTVNRDPRQRPHPKHPAARPYRTPQHSTFASSNPSILPPQTGSTVLRSFWSRVEKGLDGLVDLEDVVAGRAKQLVNSAIPKPFRHTYASTTGTVQTRQQDKPNYPRAGTVGQQSLSGPQVRSQQQQKLPGDKVPTPVITQRRSWPDKPAQRPEGLRSDRLSISLDPWSTQISNKQGQCQVPNTRGPWQDPLPPKARKLMPANGGASSPHDGGSSYRGDQQFSPENNEGSNPNRDLRVKEHTIPSGPEAPSSQLSLDPSTLASSPMHPRQMSDNVQVGSGQPEARKNQFPVFHQPDWPRNQVANQSPWSVDSSTAGNSDREPPHRRSTITPATRTPSYLDDDDDSPSKLARLLGAIPIPSFGKIFRFGRSKSYNYASLDAWEAADDKEKSSRGLFSLLLGKDRASTNAMPSTKKIDKEIVVAKPVQQLLERSARGKSTSLLSTENKRHIRGLGQSRAALDMCALGLILVGIRQLPGLESIPIPISLPDFVYNTVPTLLKVFVLSMETWAPIAFAAAILTLWSNSLLYDRRIQKRAADVAATAEAEATYSRLYLRLISSTASSRSLPGRIANASRLQGIALAETSRLQSFISYAAVTIILTTVSFIKPLCVCFARTLFQLITLQELRCWPVPVMKLIAGIASIVSDSGRELRSLLESQLKGAGHHPLQVAFKLCTLATLVAVAYLPSLEKRRKILPSDDEEEDSDESAMKMAEQITSLGASSASRLSFQSKRGWAESAIERWRLLQDESAVMDAGISIGSLVRRLGYYIASWVILAAPLLIFGFILNVPMAGWSSTPMSAWQSLLEVSILLLYTNGLVWEAMTKVVESRDLDPDIPGFLESLAQASSEMISQHASSRPLMGAVIPTAGLMVKDFWSAHVYRRGWAVRGAHLSCRSGEVVVVIGDDGSGKSRLLTTLAESIVLPPKQSLTVTKVRGSIAIGGIDVAQWDRKEVRKRVGVCLTDVNTLALRAGLWSGMSLEEILEPGDGLLKVADPTHASGPVEKACLVLALKITGLYWSLLPRLPSKLATILTASEEELRPSPLRPRYHLVSPTDWSKLLLAQVLAQALYDNDNASGSADRFDNRLVGSILLLDDGTNMLSEIEESNLLRDLRRTGVATVLTSNRWATGRLADRIAVMKDGAIIETGTHHELLSRGPQQSWYAAKWNAMTAP